MKKLRKHLYSIDGRFINFCLKYKLGKTKYGAQGIFFIMNTLGKFTFYTNTRQTEARGHFVPQFILKRFWITDDESKKKCVHLYSKSQNAFGHIPTRDAAQIKDLYIFRDQQGNLSDFTEKKLYGRIETSASKIIRRLIDKNGHYEFTFLESSILATYVAFQITRVPAFLVSLERFICYLVEHKGLDFHNDLCADEHNLDFNAIKKNIVENECGVTKKDLDNYDKKISFTSDKGDMKNIMSALQLIANAIANDISEKIHRKNLHIFSTEEKNLGDLVVSDNPVVFFKDQIGFVDFPAWWEITDPKIWLMLPLSPTKAIFFRNGYRKDGLNYDCQGGVFVNMNNAGQFTNYLDEIYSNNLNYLKRLKHYFRDV